MRAYERLLEYVKVKTPSSEESMETPSSSCQFELAERLVGEMKELGIEDAAVDGKCYVYGTIPATEGYENSPSLGFIAHMDTVSEFTENPIHPVLHENYDGQNLVFDEGGRVLDTVLFPHLKNLKGRTLITSDGTTILGADDKAGIAEIMTMAEYVLRSDVPHGKICLAFTPDEEIGRGADHFDVEGFAADFAYTVDGGAEGEIEYENFNACEAVFKIQGVNVHPGSAKGIMVNAGAVGCEIQMMLPVEETPEQTEGYEGFYHLIKISGSCERAELIYIVRDHDADKFAQKQQKLKEIADAVDLPLVVCGCKNVEKDAELFSKAAEALNGRNAVILSAKEENYKTVGAAAGLAYKQVVGAESAVDINLAKQLNVLISQLGVDSKNVVMNVGTAAVGYGFEYVISTMDRVKAAALQQGDANLQMPIITPVASEAWGVKEAMASETDAPEWGSQEERGIDMEVETAMAVIAAGSNAVILKHPESIKIISGLMKELV